MKSKIYCPVCQMYFISKDSIEIGKEVICNICGARLEITELEPQFSTRRVPQDPEDEIYDRVETFAQMRGYVFDDNKEDIMSGLLEKNRKFGDFYCPCRFDNVPENVCPCLETRRNAVRKEGSCF